MIKKADIILIISILVLSLILGLIVYAAPFEGEYYVCVYIDGMQIDAFSLEGDYREIDIQTVYGYNLLVISDGMAFINKSDCNTKSCIGRGVISRPGSMIICAPHNLIIKIQAKREES